VPVPASAAGSYELDLTQPTDFVAQTNLVQCVGASMQMMINLAGTDDDRTADTQYRLFQLARQHSPPRPAGRGPRRGASVHGWARGLNLEGHGPYRVVGLPTIQEATRSAARAMRTTGRPVGLLMWAGRHAWVMSGFTATADPLTDPSFQVTGVNVMDPLYPRDSVNWGPSPVPGSSLSLAALGEQFVPRRRGWSGALAEMYVLVLPTVVEDPSALRHPVAS
jgi:hypothetical protein